MSKKKLVPRLRFKEFEKDGEWKKLCLDELVNIVDGDRGTNYPSKKDFTNNGHTLFLNASNVTKLGFKFEENQYISEIKSNLMGNGKLLSNDIILTSRGSIGNIAIYNERINRKYPYVRINSGMLILRNRNIADSYFIGQYLKSPSGKYQIKLISFGSAQPQLTKNDVSNYSVVHPIDLSEQRRIGDFLNKFDEIIQLQQTKINKVKNINSAYLSEMFPKEGEKYPKRRFEGFTEPWEEYKLKDMGRSLTGLSGKSKKDFGHGEAEFVTYMNVFNNPIAKSTQTAQVEVDENQTEVEYGDIFFTVSSETPNEVGMSSVWLYNRPNVYLNSFCFGFRPTVNLNPYYMAYMLRSPEIRKRFILLAQGISRYNISKTKAMELLFPIPSNEEQEKIGQFFKNLDNQISTEEEKLVKLEKLKQAYLNDMFV